MEEKNINDEAMSFDDLFIRIAENDKKKNIKVCFDDSEFDNEETEQYQNKNRLSKFELYKTGKDADK